MIESSERLTFAPYNLAYPKLEEHVEAVGFDVEENKWDMIFDFTDTNEAGEKITHFKMLEPANYQLKEQPVEDMDEQPEFPFSIPQRYGGNAKDNDLMKKEPEGEVFDIRTTSAADAQKIFEEHERRKAEVEPEEPEEPVMDGKRQQLLS